MAPPTLERSKVIAVPLPPLPEFYQDKREGAKTATKSTSASADLTKTATFKARHADQKVTAKVEISSKPKAEILPPAKPPSHDTALRAKPTKPDVRSLPVPKPPPSLPPGLERADLENMTYRYSSHHHRQPDHHPTVVRIKTTKETQPQPARMLKIPPPPPGFPGPPLAPAPQPVVETSLTIVHICRICLRPRSEKYHLEHPIPANGAPPPPGICRRCRITSIREINEHTKVVHVEESEPVKIGISAFLPGENVYTREEAIKAVRKQHQKGYAELFVRQESSEGESESERVVYRHVKRTRNAPRGPSPNRRAEVSVENLAAMNLMNDQFSPKLEMRTSVKTAVVEDPLPPPESFTISSSGQNVDLVEVSEGQKPSKPAPKGYTTSSSGRDVRVIDVVEVQQPGMPESSTSTSSSKTSKPVTVTAQSAKDDRSGTAKASVSVKTSLASRQSSVQATAQVAAPAGHGYSEAEIRTFARDEVERYRQAERKIEAHPSAYAHGRLVPVTPPTPVPIERRIDIVREVAEPKPWEVPSSPPRMPSPVPIHATVRPDPTSVASTAGSVFLEPIRSEESRHWCRVADSESSATKSSSSNKIQPTRTASRRSTSDRYERDVEITVDRSRRPPSPWRLPESDPPVSVKLKEVVELVRDEPMRTRRRSKSPQRHREDIIEVTEEIELPPGYRLEPASMPTPTPPVSNRIKVLRGEPERSHHRSSAPSAEEVSDSRVGSFRTNKSYCEADAVIRTASDRSAPREEIRVETKVRSRQSSPRSERRSVILKAPEEQDEVTAMPSPRQFLPELSNHGRSEDDSWYAARVNSVKKHRHITETRPQDDDDKTVWPADEIPVRPAASERPSLKDDWDWEYRKRIVTAAHLPPGASRDEGGPGRYYEDVERKTRYRRPSQSVARADEDDQQPSVRYSQVSSKRPPSTPDVSMLTEVRSNPPPSRGRGPLIRDSDESAHVHFASKVEFSPTPPRHHSDESLPERILHIKPLSEAMKKLDRRSALRNQIDGGASEPPESTEEIISEHKSRHSRRTRSPERREDDSDFVSARMTSLVKGSSSRAPDSSRSESRSRHSHVSRYSVSVREEDALEQDHPRNDERSPRGRTTDRRSGSPGGTETATQLSRSRPLQRALSESPSRERMRLDYLRAKGREPRTETATEVSSRGRRQSEQELNDGKGPYREEARTESMDVLFGSGHGGPRRRGDEFVVRERW